jgi:LysM repeat protein
MKLEDQEDRSHLAWQERQREEQPRSAPGPAPQPEAEPGPGRTPTSEGAAPVVSHWAEAGADANAEREGAPATTYVVRAGDTLSGIARRMGTTVEALQRANGITNPNQIRVGQRLTIPASAPVRPGQQPGQQPDQQPPAQQPGQQPGQQPPAQQLPGDVQYNANALATVSESVVAVTPNDDREYAEANVPVILRQCAARGVRNANQVAYILATTEHESHFGKPKYSRSVSLVEDNNRFTQNPDGTWTARNHLTGAVITRRTKAELEIAYWDNCYGRAGNNLGNRPGTSDAASYRGRGFVQLTGRSNYREMSELLNSQGFSYTIGSVTYGGQGNPPIDLLAHPDHVNRVPDLAARIMVSGMQEGSFTGQSLDDHIHGSTNDFYNARSIVNGDKEKNGTSIANIARRYQRSLGGWASVFQVEQDQQPGE